MLRHSWDLTPSSAIALQKELAGQVVVAPLDRDVAAIAGTDCAFLSGGSEILAVAVLCDTSTMQVLETAWHRQKLSFPYVPGLLSFREAPAVIAAIEKLPRRADLLMCDGQGVAHPRGFGLASHVGVWLDLPTIGVAKSRLCGEHREPGLRRGSRSRLMLDGRCVGSVLRTRDGVKPLYISVGHRITLDESIRWTLRCGRGVRLPEPTRQAHLLVTQLTCGEGETPGASEPAG